MPDWLLLCGWLLGCQQRGCIGIVQSEPNQFGNTCAGLHAGHNTHAAQVIMREDCAGNVERIEKLACQIQKPLLKPFSSSLLCLDEALDVHLALLSYLKLFVIGLVMEP